MKERQLSISNVIDFSIDMLMYPTYMAANFSPVINSLSKYLVINTLMAAPLTSNLFLLKVACDNANASRRHLGPHTPSK